MGLITAGQSFTGKVGESFSATLAYNVYLTQLRDPLPNGLSINRQTGQITGTPATKGTKIGLFLEQTKIACGQYYSLALKSDGTVVAWGSNSGNLTPPSGLSEVVAVSAGDYHSLVLKSDGTVVGWGAYHNDYGQMTVPSGLSGVVAIAAGAYHNLALKSDGTVVGWGLNDYGQSTAPSGLSEVVAISANSHRSFAVKSDGSIVQWGLLNHPTPSGLSGVVGISAGANHSLALKSDGTVVGWGEDYHGQVTPPDGLSGVVAISAGEFHSLALKSNGTVIAWGSTSSGSVFIPMTVPAGLSDVVAVAAGGRYALNFSSAFSLALKSDGTVVAWGSNRYGETSVPNGLSLGAATSVSFIIAEGTPIITESQNATGKTGEAFAHTFSLTDSANRPVTSWAATGLPAGLSLNTATGAITGTPLDTGSTTVTLTATGPGGSDTETAVISITMGVPIIVPGQSFSGKVGESFSSSLALEYALVLPATSWARTSGTLPAGLTLNTSTGAITGTPTTKGSFTASFTATGDGGTSAATSVSFVIAEGVPIIVAGQSASGAVGTAFSKTFSLTDSANRSVTSWAATGLPSWATLNTTTGAITGTPLDTGSTTVTLTATGPGGSDTETAVISIAVGAPIITAGQSFSGKVGEAFTSSTPTLDDALDRPATSWSVTGLPAGLTLNTSTGAITGTPTTKGSFTPSFTATGGGGTSAVRSIAFTFTDGVPIITAGLTASPWVQLGQDLVTEVYYSTMQTVSLNAAGDRVAIGAPGYGYFGSGQVRVYSWNGTAWVQLGQNIDGAADFDQCGFSVSLNAAGDRMAIGSRGHSNHVRVYSWNGTAWVILGYPIVGERSGDQTGASVSLNAAGDRVAIGAPSGGYLGSGQFRVYSWTGIGWWVQLGQDIDGEEQYDDFGHSVSLNAAGDRVAIGAPESGGNASISGFVKVYSWNGTSWVQLGQKIDGEAAGNRSGSSVSLNATGDRVAIGAYGNDNNGSSNYFQTGHVRVYSWLEGAWAQLAQDIDGKETYGEFGRSVSLNAAGDRVAIGARPPEELSGNPTITDSTSARVYSSLLQPMVLLGRRGVPFTSSSVAALDITNRPVTSWSATGLPAGLSINSSTGEISGTPQDISNTTIQITATGPGGTDTETVPFIVTVKYIVYALGTLVKKVMYGSTIVKDILSRSTVFWSFTPFTTTINTTITGFRAIFTGAVNLVLDTIQTALTSNTSSNPTVPSTVRGITLSSPSSVTSIVCGTSSPKLGGTIDVSSFPNLTSISCAGNGIKKFQGYGSLTKLVDITLNNNEFNQVGFETLSNKPGLRTLNFAGSVSNQYINWTGAFPDLSAITTLVTVNINNSSLTGSNLNLSALTNLTSLSIHANLLSGAFPILPTGANSKLVGINISQNKTTRFTGTPPLLTDHPACTSLVYANNDVTGPIQDLSVRPTLTNFWCNGCLHTGNIPNLSSNTVLGAFRANGQRGTTRLTGYAGGTVSATLGDFWADSNQLPAAAVNAILAAFVAAGRVKTATNTCTLNLGGTGNAAPTGQGITDKQTLQARGWTVTTN